ncbi:hypothetical protein KM043_002107 [Ampulex compressa]|nr:hypothetical protein KM043_002107 [Ampulex compressa]
MIARVPKVTIVFLSLDRGLIRPGMSVGFKAARGPTGRYGTIFDAPGVLVNRAARENRHGTQLSLPTAVDVYDFQTTSSVTCLGSKNVPTHRCTITGICRAARGPSRVPWSRPCRMRRGPPSCTLCKAISRMEASLDLEKQGARSVALYERLKSSSLLDTAESLLE